MRQLVVGTFLTLDGVMQAPGGPDEDRDGGFRHGGWLVPYFDEEFGAIMTEWTKHAGAFLLGRKTYEIFAASWPNATDPADEVAAALDTRPKFVASRTLHDVGWNNSQLLRGDVADTTSSTRCASGTSRSCSAPASASSATGPSRAPSGSPTRPRRRAAPCCTCTSAPAPSGTARWKWGRRR